MLTTLVCRRTLSLQPYPLWNALCFLTTTGANFREFPDVYISLATCDSVECPFFMLSFRSLRRPGKSHVSKPLVIFKVTTNKLFLIILFHHKSFEVSRWIRPWGEICECRKKLYRNYLPFSSFILLLFWTRKKKKSLNPTKLYFESRSNE